MRYFCFCEEDVADPQECSSPFQS